MDSYLDFLKRKIPRAELAGFEPPSAPHASLFPHQVDICQWAVRGGRRAIFANFGLGKTRIHLQLAQWVVEQTAGRYLIVAPLGVRQEFTCSDAPAMGMEIEYVRNDAEVALSKCRVLITNYERVRDGAIDVGQFAGAGLDESSVLRSFGSKTYQEFLKLFRAVPSRFVFTATPSPNRYKELIHYGGFLGVMDTDEALTRFFQRDSSEANNLTLYPHMENQFWAWLGSWAVFLQRPSDLGYSDEGYDLPPIRVHWHKVEVNHREAWQQTDSWGQSQLFMDQAQGLAQSAACRRESIAARLEKAMEIIHHEDTKSTKVGKGKRSEHRLLQKAGVSIGQEVFWKPAPTMIGQGSEIVVTVKGIHLGKHDLNRGVPAVEVVDKHGNGYRAYPGEMRPLLDNSPSSCSSSLRGKSSGGKHWLLWHDLEAEREAIERLIPDAVTVYGSQDLELREDRIMGFSRGEFRILATKPVIAGSGCNFQRHCADAVFLGVGYKFNDFIQAVHRIHRFQQPREVNIHIIYLDSESTIMETLKAKWARHEELTKRMAALLRKHRLSNTNTMELIRTLGCERDEVRGENFRMVRNDCVLELQTMPEKCVDFICTSIPFGNQYEYSPSFNDFGHNTGDDPFFEQMGYLVPELHRVLKPGRVAAVHVKDRILFGNVTGLAMPTVNPFSDKTTAAFLAAGFVLMARITIDTDVVRENNQTYRLGWSENAKDSSKMGAGMPEYVLVFRRLPSDLSNGYADVPVRKDKAEYTRADWQLDAAGLWRSNGNRLPDPEVLRNMPLTDIKRLWIEHCLAGGYDHAEHVELAKALEERGKLPSSFMLFPPVSRHKDVWTDIARMRTLNTEQSRRNVEKHVCPLQLDIIKRLITRYTNPGETVLDPFAGIGSVPYQALRMERAGWGIELNEEYWRCAVGYCEQAEAEQGAPTLFDLAKECSGAVELAHAG